MKVEYRVLRKRPRPVPQDAPPYHCLWCHCTFDRAKFNCPACRRARWTRPPATKPRAGTRSHDLLCKCTHPACDLAYWRHYTKDLPDRPIPLSKPGTCPPPPPTLQSPSLVPPRLFTVPGPSTSKRKKG